MPLQKIVIITDALTQPLYHARVRNLVRTLQEHNIAIDWITEKHQEIPEDLNLPQIIQIPFYKNPGIIGKIEWLVKNTLNLLFDYKNRHFTNKVLKYVSNKEYDMVFCSTFHTFGLRTAQKIAEQKKIPLHIDLRDIAEQCTNNEYSRGINKIPLNFIGKLYRNINIARRNKILQKADSISSVSPWHVNFLSQFNPNVHLIYNGYDATLFYPQKKNSKTFDIVYTGKWYGESLQDPTLLFEALSEIDKPLINSVWYTNPDVHKTLQQLSNKSHSTQNRLLLNEYVPSHEIPTILTNSSIILVLTNKDTQGIMTTKFFEALGVEKPILCVRSDEGCLAQMIKETKSGIAATSVVEVKDFILNYYEQWKEDGYTHIAIKNKEQFSRQNQALQFEELFNSILKK